MIRDTPGRIVQKRTPVRIRTLSPVLFLGAQVAVVEALPPPDRPNQWNSKRVTVRQGPGKEGRKGLEDSSRGPEGCKFRPTGEGGTRIGLAQRKHGGRKGRGSRIAGRKAECAARRSRGARFDARGAFGRQSRRSLGGYRTERGARRSEFLAAAS